MVWDPLVRATHWLIAALFLSNFWLLVACCLLLEKTGTSGPVICCCWCWFELFEYLMRFATGGVSKQHPVVSFEVASPDKMGRGVVEFTLRNQALVFG